MSVQPASPALVPQTNSKIAEMHEDRELCDALGTVERAWSKYRYSYNFTWLGIPIIQIPQDIVALQEIIWSTDPELIIETGIAHGGSLILSASILALRGNHGRVVGVDIDIRPHNRDAIEGHPLAGRISMIEGSSIAPEIISHINKLAAGKRTMVILDSNHTHEHVMAELAAYAPLVSPGLYCCVMDTIVERIPEDVYTDRPWGKGNSPGSAVDEFVRNHPEFTIDKAFDEKLGLSMAPRGYLRRADG